MKKLRIVGGKTLCGEVKVQGAKNAALPILAAALLAEGPTQLYNCPAISDVTVTLEILKSLGCQVSQKEDCVTLLADNAFHSHISEHLMRRMRSSVIFLGALLGRFGEATLSYPGGCQLGPRPIDLHLSSLEKLGAVIQEQNGQLRCTCSRPLKGTRVNLTFPSVGATENILLAACMAQGETIIEGAACEPEIINLAQFLNACGANIQGAGSPMISIQGVKKLRGCCFNIQSDRIVAATYLACIALTGGEALLANTNIETMGAVIHYLEQAGCRLLTSPGRIYCKAPKRPKSMGLIRTMPYPGFPTDAQAPMAAVASVAKGTTILVETIFSDRFKYCSELLRMGAKIQLVEHAAVIQGIPYLQGTSVVAEDLRGGAALAAAALKAEGETLIEGIEHIQRGYMDLAGDLQCLGADASWVEQN